jgi:hypothetical protein
MGPLSSPRMIQEWIWSSRGMILTEENWRTQRKTSPSATLPTTNPIWAALGINLGLCGEKPVTNHLSYGTALISPEDGGSMFLQNDGTYLQVHVVLQPKRPTLTSLPSWEPQIYIMWWESTNKVRSQDLHLWSSYGVKSYFVNILKLISFKILPVKKVSLIQMWLQNETLKVE